jgi:hypothetical protein
MSRWVHWHHPWHDADRRCGHSASGYNERKERKQSAVMRSEHVPQNSGSRYYNAREPQLYGIKTSYSWICFCNKETFFYWLGLETQLYVWNKFVGSNPGVGIIVRGFSQIFFFIHTDSSFSTSSRPSLGSTQPPIQLVPGAVSPGVKQPRRETDQSPPATPEAKGMLTSTSTPPIRDYNVVRN